MAETFEARSSVRGGTPWVRRGPSVEALMRRADEEVQKGYDIVIRGERTSDGTEWGVGRGRLLAMRENGRWHRE